MKFWNFWKVFSKKGHFNNISLIVLVPLKTGKKLILDKYLFFMASKLFFYYRYKFSVMFELGFTIFLTFTISLIFLTFPHEFSFLWDILSL